MKRMAVVGAGITGLCVGRLFSGKYRVTLFEKEKTPGGLIRCDRVKGSLFHLCGGHVFNTKDQKVADWFWSIFDRENDFIKADRKSAVCCCDGNFVDYPIENHVYQLNEDMQRSFVRDMLQNDSDETSKCDNFDDFLRMRFGKTLYDFYFRPYNAKVWRCDLRDVPLSWLKGKLPMPSVEDMLWANINHVKEKDFVHSSFWYPRNRGSQFIADGLADGLEIVYGMEVQQIIRNDDGVYEIGGMLFDTVVFCGNLKFLPSILDGQFSDDEKKNIAALQYHGTTAVFCETDSIPYSWFYQPSQEHDSHRFICTGNFSPANNAHGRMTCTIEFTDYVDEKEIKRQLELMPFNPKYLAHYYSEYTYPIQHSDTRNMLAAIKKRLSRDNIYLVGRFAEWEYYNMDAAVGAAMRLFEELNACD